MSGLTSSGASIVRRAFGPRGRKAAAAAAAWTAGAFAGSPALAQCATVKLTAGDVEEGDNFGAGLSMSGDVVVVGSPFDDDLGADSGSVYVFERDHGGPDAWGQVAKLHAQDGVAGDELGFPVSVSGDLALVGARLSGPHGRSSGSAYLFARDAGGPDAWGQVAELTAPDGEADDTFGSSLAISGDLALVGARRDDDAGDNSGSAYVFARNQGGPDGWGLVEKLIAPDGEALDDFGSVAISGDVAVVGARRDDDLGTDSGSAYVFARDHGGPDNWGFVTKLTAEDGAAGDDFGHAVAVDGDRILVGARRDDDLGADSGSAYVFARNHGGPDAWGQVAKLTAADGEANDAFGAVSIRGDLALVGAVGNDDFGSDSGSAYVFARDQGGLDAWGQVAKWTAPDAAAGDQFGFPISIGGERAAIGAYRDGDGAELGAVYVHFMGEPAASEVYVGAGSNPVEFASVTQPALGTTWESDVVTTPSVGDETLATIVVLGRGGTTPGITIGPAGVGTILVLPGYLIVPGAGGSHQLSIPCKPSLVGAPYPAQAARIERLTATGELRFVFLNALLLTLGTAL